MNHIEFEAECDAHRAERSVKSYSRMKSFLSEGQLAESSSLDMNLMILRNFTVEPLLTFLEVDSRILGLKPTFKLGNFDSIAQDSNSDLIDFDKFDFLVILQILETISPTLGSRYSESGKESARSEIDRVVSLFRMYLTAIREKSNTPILLNTFPIPDFPGLGLADGRIGLGQIDAILELNSDIRKLSLQFQSVYVLDFFSILARCGNAVGLDERMWTVAMNPFSPIGMIEISKEISRTIKALALPRKKCLILDCDNVLWNGVTGEEGVKSMNLSLQRFALDLRFSGVFIALASKNNEQDVFEVLENDDRAILRKEHLAAWEINWEDKAGNIRKIADSLNIGLDSVVFVDDSLFECNLVREILPEVKVLQFDGHESKFRKLVIESGLFDALVITDEDRLKTSFSIDDLKRKELRDRTSSLQDYLDNLGVEVEIGFMRMENIARISQLSKKTNQFNLTTERLDEADFHSFLLDPFKKVLYLRAKDKIADLGLVGSAILSFREHYVFIDNLLLSCRALGRGIEKTFLSEIKRYAFESGYTKIVARYIESTKNGQVAEYYRDNGFRIAEEFGKGYFEIDLKEGVDCGPAWIGVEFKSGGGEQ